MKIRELEGGGEAAHLLTAESPFCLSQEVARAMGRTMGKRKLYDSCWVILSLLITGASKMLDDFGSSTCRSEMAVTAELLELHKLMTATILHSCETLHLHSEESISSLNIFMDYISRERPRLHGGTIDAASASFLLRLLD